MKKYTRVSYETRCQIHALLQVKKSIPEIAKVLGFDKSTIYRELKRNWKSNQTTPKVAHKRALLKKKSQVRRLKICNKLEQVIEDKLLSDWSPEQIAGRLKLEKEKLVSHQTIYNYIYKYRPELRYKLRRFKKRGAGRYRQRMLYYKKRNGLSIHQRPKIANDRGRVGDWERDTMHTLNGIQLLVCNDRKSRLTKIEKLVKRDNIEVGKQTMKLIKETGRRALTMTNDNGGDFKANVDLGIPTYFCDPLKPQQRGTVENTIGLLRQFVKRKTDVSNFTKKDLKKLEDKINLRPRKVLGYRTPYEVYYNKKVALAI